MRGSLRDVPEGIRELHEAYCAASGMPVSLGNYDRQMVWTQIAALEAKITPADVTALIGAIKKKIARGELPPESLEFRNAIGNVGKLEERILAMRQQAARRRGDGARAARQGPAAQTRQVGPDGETVSVIAPRVEAGAVPVANAAAALRSMARDLDRKHGETQTG